MRYEVGQTVWRRSHAQSVGGERISKKLLPKFIVPCRVSEIYSPSQVRLETPDRNDLGRWHVDQLKPYISD